MRRAAAEDTRRAILDAASRRFAERGVAATTIAAIAEAAGVAVPTVYATWTSKDAILAGVIGDLKDDADVAGLYRELVAEPDARRQLAMCATITRRFCERAWAVMDSVREASRSDPKLAVLFEEVESRRLRGMERVVRGIEARGGLAAGLSAREATDVLWTLCSHDVYRQLVIGREWSKARYERWLGDTLAHLLLAT